MFSLGFCSVNQSYGPAGMLSFFRKTYILDEACLNTEAGANPSSHRGKEALTVRKKNVFTYLKLVVMSPVV